MKENRFLQKKYLHFDTACLYIASSIKYIFKFNNKMFNSLISNANEVDYFNM